MANSVFDGMADAIFSVLKETASAILISTSEEGPPVIQTVEIIFNERHAEVDPNGTPFGEPRPVAWVKTSAFTNECDKPKYGDEMTIQETDYMILEVKFDGLQTYQLTLGKK